MAERSELELLRAVIDTQRLLHAHPHDLDEVLNVVLERSQDLTGADAAVVQLLEGRHLVLRAGSGEAAELVGSRMDVAGSLTGLSVAERQAHRCDDTETDDRVNRELCRQLGVRSTLVVPLRMPRGEVVGSLAVHAGHPEAFDDGDVEVLDALSDLISVAFRQAEEEADRAGRALRDGLTALANRTLLLERLAVGLARSSRSEEPVTVLFLDLDGFRVVNEQLGHDAGDVVLRLVGQALQATVRPSDTVARLGSDQFVVVCESVDVPSIAELSERIRWAVACAWAGPIALTASVGLARSRAHESAEALLARAGGLMTFAKRDR